MWKRDATCSASQLSRDDRHACSGGTTTPVTRADGSGTASKIVDNSADGSTLWAPERYPRGHEHQSNHYECRNRQTNPDFLFGRRPYAGTDFTRETGECVTAQRVDIGKPKPGSFVTPVDVWVTPKA